MGYAFTEKIMSDHSSIQRTVIRIENHEINVNRCEKKNHQCDDLPTKAIIHNLPF